MRRDPNGFRGRRACLNRGGSASTVAAAREQTRACLPVARLHKAQRYTDRRVSDGGIPPWNSSGKCSL